MHLLELNLVLLVLQTGGTGNRSELLNLKKQNLLKAELHSCVFNPEVHAQANRWKVAQEYQEKVLQSKRHGCLPKPTHQSYIYMGLRSWLATALLLNFH